MKKIDKERTWVFSPVNNVVIKAAIQGDLEKRDLEEAIQTAVHNNEILHQKITIQKNQEACYESMDMANCSITYETKEWKEIIKEQEQRPFDIQNGELIRFFILPSLCGIELMLIAHHLAGDGISFSYLFQDIMLILSGKKTEYKPLKLFSMESLPKESALKFPTTWLMKTMNQKWRKSAAVFNFEDFKRMSKKYWDQHESWIETFIIEGEDYSNLISYTKTQQLTVNSLITAALIRAAEEKSDVGHAVSIREKGYTGMGNFATGISIQYQYNEKQDLAVNAKRVQNLIQRKLQSPGKKYFLLQFMGQMEPTLIDAVYFAACDGYQNKTAETFSKMFGYAGNPKGISITNLTKLPIEQEYGSLKLSDFVFIPPLVMNAKRIIGIATLGERMILSLHLNKDENLEDNVKFFHKGMEYLTKLDEL